jgi:hypothetical protein
MRMIALGYRRFVQQTLSDHENNAAKLCNPVFNSIRSASTLMRDNTDYFRGESSADYLQEILIPRMPRLTTAPCARWDAP